MPSFVQQDVCHDISSRPAGRNDRTDRCPGAAGRQPLDAVRPGIATRCGRGG
ncbi:hypothetical protein [Streptomyces sp. NPDC048411]|uniref:hypothetical protein n=1 Tax=Streptomyces sp. NPDC048411 TaxID=3157206 RepID=UPI003454EAC3